VRSPGKNNTDYGVLDLYKFYKEQQLEKGKTPVSLSDYRKIIRKFNDAVCTSIVECSDEFRMPYRLGYLRIRKFKQRLKIDADGKLITKHLEPDWQATKQLWAENEKAKEEKKLVWHTNKHTQGYYYKWYWDKSACNITNHSVYSIVIARKYKRLVAKTVKENKKIDYYE
jgi:hypothetical protein